MSALLIFVRSFILTTLSAHFPRLGVPTSSFTFSNVIAHLRTLSPGMKSLLSEVIRLAKIVLVSAATNSTSERSFSAMRRAKSYLQSTMGQERLNNIMMLHVHKNRTDDHDLVDIANDFNEGSEYRLKQFGKFTHIDNRNK